MSQPQEEDGSGISKLLKRCRSLVHSRKNSRDETVDINDLSIEWRVDPNARGNLLQALSYALFDKAGRQLWLSEEPAQLGEDLKEVRRTLVTEIGSTLREQTKLTEDEWLNAVFTHVGEGYTAQRSDQSRQTPLPSLRKLRAGTFRPLNEQNLTVKYPSSSPGPSTPLRPGTMTYASSSPGPSTPSRSGTPRQGTPIEIRCRRTVREKSDRSDKDALFE